MSNPSDNDASPVTNPTDPQKEIEQRLNRLRDATHRVMAQREIEERLAKLANREPNYYTQSEPPIKIYQLISKQQRMTDTEKADGLMEQLFNEMNIDEQYAKDGAQVDAEIERRLAILRGQQQQQQTAGGQSSTTTHQQATLNMDARPKNARELIAEIMAQPDHEMASSDDDSAVSSDEDELEWCATCNEDGVLRCLDCDNDIYCRECFREFHSDSETRRHRTTAYNKSSNAKGQSKSGKKKP